MCRRQVAPPFGGGNVRIGEIRPTWDGWAWPSYCFRVFRLWFSLVEASDGSLLFCCLVFSWVLRSLCTVPNVLSSLFGSFRV